MSEYRESQNGNYNSQDHEEGSGSQMDEKAQQYIRDLLNERVQLSKIGKFPHSERLLEAEIAAAKQSNKPFRDNRYVDVYREKQIRVIIKVSIPVKEYPKFNFVGKLLGPNGNSFRRLQEETMCKMAILGRGSMKDKQREEELRNSLDPKYAHLNEDLHVEISALGPPAEAHARIAYALAEVRKFLIPDANDTIRQEQLREILSGEAGQEVAERVRHKMAPRMQHPPTAHPPISDQRGHPPPPAVVQSVPSRTNVHSILERARISMEESHRYEEHGHHEAGPPQHTYQPHHPHAYDPRYQNPVPNGPQAHPAPVMRFY